VLRSITLACLFLLLLNAQAAQKKILFYGLTYNPDGKAEQLVETSLTEF
jgi:hypothetical protein